MGFGRKEGIFSDLEGILEGILVGILEGIYFSCYDYQYIFLNEYQSDLSNIMQHFVKCFPIFCIFSIFLMCGLSFFIYFY